MKLDEYGFRIPTWPLACPPVHSQADILSVTVGNTHLTWTVHGTFEEQFIPGVFWRYILVSFIVVRVLLDFLPLISLLYLYRMFNVSKNDRVKPETSPYLTFLLFFRHHLTEPLLYRRTMGTVLMVTKSNHRLHKTRS